MESNRTSGWSETLKRPLSEAQQVFGEVSKDARTAVGELGQVVAPVGKSLEQAIVAHPFKAIGISFAAGIFLGWLMKRV